MSGWNDPGADPAEAWDRTNESAPSHAELAEHELMAAHAAKDSIAPADRFEPLYFAGVHAQLAIAEELARLRELLAGEQLAPAGSTEVHVHTGTPTDAAPDLMRRAAARYPYLHRNTNR